MIFLLSPAKTMKSVQNAAMKATAPSEALAGKAQSALTELQALSCEQLKSLLKVSDAITKLNYDRYHSWSDQLVVPAVLAFDGPAYKGLQAEDMDDASLRYLQGHLRILCGLYGVLRPLDALKPYRLEMGTKLKVGSCDNLYEFWRDSITDHINAELTELPKQQRFVVNCASQEYFKVVDTKRLTAPVINVAFLDNSTFRVKQARGAIVRHMCLCEAVHPAELKSFTGLNGEWSYIAEQSSDSEYKFAFSPASKPAANGKSAPSRKAAASRAPATGTTAAANRAARRDGQLEDTKLEPTRRKQPATQEAAANNRKRAKKTAQQ